MGRFSDSPYFLLQKFFDGLSNTQPIEKPVYDFDWPVKFVSSFDNGDGTRTFASDPYTFDNTVNTSSDIIFTNYRLTEWNREIYFDPNIVHTFNSYIVAPMINITAKGGGLFDLFVKERDVGYQEITVRYIDRIDNQFNFVNAGIPDIEPGQNITEQLSGLRYTFTFWDKVLIDTFNLFENNREAYFRKDSLYHEWLRLMAKDQLLEEMGIDFDIRNYVNTDKLFSYFHNIFKSRDGERCRIIFDGMKDFVVRAVPEHQRTPAFVELCNVFFDQLYQEIFDLLKNVWSLIDPMEVDDRYLGYLSRYYDMFDVDIEGASLLHVREFIRDMIWMIKRKGTYTQFYILWRILTTTKNILNIYERWHRKDVENFPEWPSTISPSCTGSWPNFPYYGYTNPDIQYPKYYGGVWPPPSGSTTIDLSGGTTVVPPSAWVDVMYMYRDEYEVEEVDFGAGPGWYRKRYPDVYNTEYIPPSANMCLSGGFMDTPLAPSGDNLMLSTHYIIETDVTSEPLGANDIITREIWDNMYGYWEYLRPVNRVSNYRIVVAPITDMSGQYIHLYERTRKSSAFLKTKSGVSIGLEDDAHVHDQTQTPSKTWTINHNLGEDILLQVFNNNFDEIVPDRIEYGISIAKLYFSTPSTGFAIMRRAEWVARRQPPVMDETWRFYHLQLQRELIAHYKYDKDRFYAKDTILSGESFADAEFSDREENTVMVGPGNFIYVQSTPEQTWNIPHDLSMKGVLMSVYTFDDVRIHPENYHLIDSANCSLEFSEPVSGYVVLVSVGDLSVEDVIAELEELINGMYFVVYNYDQFGNRIQREISHNIKTYKDDNFYYFDLMLDKTADYIINEIDVFSGTNRLMFHLIMSNFYKPGGVDTTFHIRLEIPSYNSQ
jgi:hypothetical protein